ncbi:MAG: hypothetical protein LBC06_04070 [Rickettsiales bacterium]|jgi:preprotein translocase subunit SecA|nr:hypothetical protein [Rickettsiales bacterium]
MHGRSQNVNYGGDYISDEEFHNAEENDFSDLESIPGPSSFQVRNLSGSVPLNQSKFDYFDNIYQGSIKDGKLSGFGKLSSNDEEHYIEGTWKNSRLVEISSCQFYHSVISRNEVYHVRICGKDNLFTFNKNNFVARIRIGELKGLDFTKPLVELKKDFLEQVTITKILEDDLLNERDNAFKQFLQNANSAHAEDLFQFCKILEKRFFSKFQDQNISMLEMIVGNIYISNGLKICAERLLNVERLFLKRNSIFPKFGPDAQHNLQNLLQELQNIRSKGVDNYRKLLLSKCSHYFLSTVVVNDIYNLGQKILYLSDKDIQLFSDLTTLIDQPEWVKQLWNVLSKKVQETTNDSLKDIGPLTNPIYLHLFKSLQELIIEISNKTNIPKQDLLKIDRTGSCTLLKDIKWSQRSHTTYSIERQYRFIFKLIEHFKPGRYYHKSKFKHKFKLSGPTTLMPEERLVWLYILDDAMESIREYQESYYKSSKKSKKDFKELLDSFLTNYTKFISGIEDDRYELFRVAAHNTIKLAAQVSPIFCVIESEPGIDKKILDKQLEYIHSIFTSKSVRLPSDYFINLIDVYNEYWEHRKYIESIPKKLSCNFLEPSMKNISRRLLNIVYVSLDKKVTPQVLVNYLRSFNEFIKHFQRIDFKWFIKKELVSYELITKKIVSLFNDKESYEVLMPQEFINYKQEKTKKGSLYLTSTHKHYVIEAISKLLDIVEKSLQKEWSNDNKVCLEATSELLLAIGHSFIHLKEQPNYVSFEQFLIDSTKPFDNAVNGSTTYEDFKKRIVSIENFYLYAKKQNEISIDQALSLYQEEVENLRRRGFDTSFDRGVLKSCYNKYLEKYHGYTTNEVDIQYITRDIKDTITKVENQLKNKKWTTEFKQNIVPLLLAGLAAIWSKLESKDIECTKEKFLKPHCIQILCILKLLSVDTQNENIDSQFAQVLTGQGKSIILGLLSSLLALMEYKVQVVCYSKYLVCRDQQSFEDFFEILRNSTTRNETSYGTFDNMASDTVSVDVNDERVDLRTCLKSS